MLKLTALNAAHRAAGARLIYLGGWEMPLSYGSLKVEHLAVRTDCGMFDVSSLGQVDVCGPDARAFLLRLLANDVDKLDVPGKSLYSPMLNAEGGVMDELIVHRTGDTQYRLVLDAERCDQSFAWMTACQTAWGMALTLTRHDPDALATIAVQGPTARARVWEVLPGIRAATQSLPAFRHVCHGDLLIATTGYTGEDGFEITLPADGAEPLWQALRAAGVPACGMGARDSLRLEAGFRLYGRDLDAGVSPFEAGLGASVALSPAREFVGRAALAVHAPRWQSLGLCLSGKGVLRDQQRVRTPHGEGMITSASYSPSLEAYIAIARLPLAVAVGDEVEASMCGRALPVRVTPPRFVRHGSVLVGNEALAA